ncbi:signal peptide peptidase SppA [Candidatus Latescibacterota bacterium]
MIQRRDLFLGLALLSVFAVIILIAFIMLSTLATDGIHLAEKSVAVIEINGPIFSPEYVVKKLEKYIKDKNIPAIVIRLNTPGGGVSATQEIFETVKKARRAGKKVIASMGAVSASGGYYIAAACDSIVATPGTITGSIGVIATFPDFSGLYDKIGVGFNVRTSGKFKDTGSPARKMTDEEKAIIDEIVMDTYDQFITAVAEGREMDIDSVRKLADGRVFTGRQAQNNGLVDLLGTYQVAIDLAGVLAGLGEDPPVYKETKSSLSEMLLDLKNNYFSIGIDNNIPKISYIMGY